MLPIEISAQLHMHARKVSFMRYSFVTHIRFTIAHVVSRCVQNNEYTEIY